MSKDFLYPGQSELDGVLIVGSSGMRKEVSAIVAEFNLYQNLDSPHMSGSILLNDGDDVSSSLPLMGNERLMFSLRTPGRDPIDYNVYHAMIYNVKKRTNQTNSSHTVLCNFTTLDNFKNVHTKISKAYNGEISEIVKKLLRTDKDGIESPKLLNIETTKGIRKFVFPNISPFAAINMLKEEAIAAEGNSAHYLFYENPEGYHFRSLNSLLGKSKELSTKSKGTYIYHHPSSATAGASGRQNPDASMETILNWEIHDNTNTFLNFKTGMYSSTLLTHDIFNKNVQKFEYDYEAKYKSRNSANMASHSHGPIVSTLKQSNGKSLTEQYQAKTFLHPTGKGLFVKTEEEKDNAIHNNVNDWLQESIARYVERISHFILKIETYGNTDLMVGHIINIVIPKNTSIAESGTESIDRFLSGRYVVTHINHLIQPSKKLHTMHMYVMKDSLGNPPTQQDTKYQDPPIAKIDEGLSDVRIVDPYAGVYIADSGSLTRRGPKEWNHR